MAKKTSKPAESKQGGPIVWDEGNEPYEMTLPPFSTLPLFVGFLTEKREDYKLFKPHFEPTGVKEETRQRQTEEFDAMFEAQAKDSPYLGRIKTAILTGPKGRPDQVYKLMPNPPKSYALHKDPATSLKPTSVGKKFSMWSQAVLQANKQVVLVGFNVRVFAKMAGLEAAEAGFPICRPGVWFCAEYYDTEHILVPRTPSEWPTMIELRTALLRLCSDAMPPAFIATYKPGKWPGVDAMLSLYVAAKCRLFDEAFCEGGLRWEEAGNMLAAEVAKVQANVKLKIKKKA